MIYIMIIYQRFYGMVYVDIFFKVRIECVGDLNLQNIFFFFLIYGCINSNL